MPNQTTITQLAICRIKLEHNNKFKICNSFVIPETGQVLLGMPDIKLLNIFTMSCNTIGTEKEDKDANCSTNRHSTLDVGN